MVKNINIGLIGGGYMGKAHAIALHAVGATFNTVLRPKCFMICTSNPQSAQTKAAALGFKHWSTDWQEVANHPEIEAVIIATPPDLHRKIVLAACNSGKAIFCEKPLGTNVEDSQAMVEAVQQANTINMVGFNYIQTPATQLALEIVQAGEIGPITYFRGEHTEDFLSQPGFDLGWRNHGRAHGALGDLAPHMIQAALAFLGPVESLVADTQSLNVQHLNQQTAQTTNDDQAHMLCRFANGAMGSLYFSRLANGRKMGYAYQIYGEKGSIHFDQEDQNTLWLYKNNQPAKQQGFTKILSGPEHPYFADLCAGAGHGTGYQEQITIEIYQFLQAIETKQPATPSFLEGWQVNQIIQAAWQSVEQQGWVKL